MGFIKEHIKEYYDNKPDKEYKEGLLSPSMLGGCPRCMYYSLKGIKQTTPPDANAKMNFEVGNLWEAKISDILHELGFLVHWWIDGQSPRFVDENEWNGVIRHDKWVDEELGVAGTPDQIILQDGKYVLLDTKTQSQDSNKFFFKGKGEDTQMISEEEYWATKGRSYRLQLGCYMLMAKRRYEQGLEKHKIDYGKLVIISKDNGGIIFEPCLFYSKELEKDVIDRINYLRSFILNNEIPPCECIVENEYNRGKWMVSYCNYGDVSSIQPNYKKRLVPTVCCNINVK